MSDGYVHLKASKAKKGEKGSVAAIDSHEPEYPYGTRVRLGDEHVQKVYGDDLPAVGTEHEIHAKGKITEASERDGEGRHVEIQITHMKRPKAKERSVRDDLDEATEAAEKKAAEKMPAKK